MYKLSTSGQEVIDLKKKKANSIKYRYITEHILILKLRRYLKSSRNVIVILECARLVSSDMQTPSHQLRRTTFPSKQL